MSGQPDFISEEEFWGAVSCEGSRLLLPDRFLEGAAEQTKLEAWQELLSLGLESLKAFRESRFDAFDALVGENRCEIRTLMMLDLVKQEGIRERLSRDAEELLKKRAAVSQALESFEGSEERFSAFVEVEGLDVKVSQACIYLMLCRALTITKRQSADHIDQTEPMQLLEHCPALSNKQAKRMVYHWQKILSHLSVDQLTRWGRKLVVRQLWMGEVEKEWLLADDKGRTAYPALLGAQIILETLKQLMNSPLILRVNVMREERVVWTDHLVYEVDKEGNSFEYLGKTVSKNEPAFVVEGCCSEQSVMAHPLLGSQVPNIDIEKVILTAFAHKSHYPGQNKGKAPDKVREVLSPIRKGYRKNKGCSVWDSSLFCVTHISALCVAELLEDRPVHRIPKGLSAKAFAGADC